MHLLRSEARSLDESVEAVDLAQTPADIVFLSFSDSDLAAMAAAHEARKSGALSLRLANLSALRHPFSVDRYVETVVRRARFVLVRLLGGLDYWPLRRRGSPGARSGANTASPSLSFRATPGRIFGSRKSLSTLPKEKLRFLLDYLRNGGPRNLAALFGFIENEIEGPTSFVPPRPVPAFGIFEAARREGPKGAARALILLYRSVWLAADTLSVTALADALATRGFVVTSAFVTSLKDDEPQLGRSRAGSASEKPDVIMNTTAFSARLDAACGVLNRRGGLPGDPMRARGIGARAMAGLDAWLEPGRSRHEYRAPRDRRLHPCGRGLLQGRDAALRRRCNLLERCTGRRLRASRMRHRLLKAGRGCGGFRRRKSASPACSRTIPARADAPPMRSGSTRRRA